MGLAADAVGSRAGPWSGRLDARWLMAYAAGLGHDCEAYLDTTRPGGVIAHPVFPIAPEWALLTTPDSGLGGGLTITEALRGVHAAHDLHLHRPIAADLPVSVRAEIAGAQPTRVGALMTLRFEGVDDGGEPVWTSWMGVVYRGVSVDGAGRPPADAVPPPAPIAEAACDRSRTLEITAAAPHVYGECARIWNPIHTDRSVALAAGLDGVILHGSATFAHGVDAALDVLGVTPDAVLRLGASFRAPVPAPSTITTTVTTTGRLPDGNQLARFEVTNATGDPAIRNGYLIAAP